MIEVFVICLCASAAYLAVYYWEMAVNACKVKADSSVG